MIVRFDCGCIGILGTTPPKRAGATPAERMEGWSLIIKPCDLPSDMCWEPYMFVHKDMTGKSHEPLDAERLTTTLNEIGELIGDGYRFRTVKTLLGQS